MASRTVSRYQSPVWAHRTGNGRRRPSRYGHLRLANNNNYYSYYLAHKPYSGPALDFLASAIFADGDPPICELPFVKKDSAGNLFANDTIPVTVKTSPDLLKQIIEAWSKVVPRIKALEPRFHSEIARIICDLDPLENILNPQVCLLRQGEF